MRVVYSETHRLHDPLHEVLFGRPIPAYEVPARVELIRGALEPDGGFTLEKPTGHGVEPIAAVHDEGLIRFLEEAWDEWQPRDLGPELFPDSFLHPAVREGMGPPPEPRGYPVGRAGLWGWDTATPIVAGTYEAARAAVDVALSAADLVQSGEPVAYGLCRPPGHHAPRAAFGGYCFFNNAAVATQYLVERTRERAAILDVDYHHGNGTQQIFYARGDVLYVSIHGDPDRAYPYFAGFAEERGAGDGEGATLNLPLPAGCSSPEYLSALDRGLEAIEGFHAATLVVSLGVDMYKDDPTGDLALTLPAFHESGRRVAQLGRQTVILQEGGYALPRLGENVRQWLLGFEGRDLDATEPVAEPT